MLTTHIVVDALPAYVQVKGNAQKAIVFIHGSSLSSAIWRDQLNDPYLHQHYRLVTIDLPGHGQSGRASSPERQYALQSLGHTVAEVIRQLELGDYVAAGVSLGTNILSEALPELTHCKGLFLTGAPVADRETPLETLMLPAEYGQVMVTPDPDDQSLGEFLRELIYRASPATMAMLATAFKSADPAFRSNMGNVFATAAWSNEIDRLSNADIPLAIVYGRQERSIRPDYLSAYPLKMWQNRIHLLPDAGHLAHLDQPELFNRMLGEFAAGATGF